ncbi:MAG: hypothetical protein WBH77_01310 [Saccharofermentanales bacterium]
MGATTKDDKEKNKEEIKETKKCFYISPIGKDDSIIRRKMDGVCTMAIQPTLEKYGYVLVRPQEILINDITTNIVINLFESDLVIANLTDLNPNVMYELAVRDCLMKPVIIMCEDGTDIPFDIKDMNCLFYKDDAKGMNELIEMLDNAIQQIDKDPENISNIVSRAIGATKFERLIEEKASEKDRDVLIEMNRKITSIEDLMRSKLDANIYRESSERMFPIASRSSLNVLRFRNLEQSENAFFYLTKHMNPSGVALSADNYLLFINSQDRHEAIQILNEALQNGILDENFREK